MALPRRKPISRLHIAAMCLQGLLSNAEYLKPTKDRNDNIRYKSIEDITADAFWYADALITKNNEDRKETTD